MRENNVPDWYIESCGKIKYMFLKPMRQPTLHGPSAYLKCTILFITIVPTSFNWFQKHLSLKRCSGLDAGKARMEDIKEKRQRNGATNVENDLFTTLEIANEMLERGFTLAS